MTDKIVKLLWWFYTLVFFFLVMLPGLLLAFCGFAVFLLAAVFLGTSKLLFVLGVKYGLPEKHPEKQQLLHEARTLYDNM